MKGLGKGLGLSEAKDLPKTVSNDFYLIYTGTEDDPDTYNLKAKIRRIEEFDAKVVRLATQWIKNSNEPCRAAVVSNGVHSLNKKSRTRAHAPFLIHGAGVDAKGPGAFTEKNCAQSGILIEPGAGFLDRLLEK